jgi:hypothetical protein
MNRMAQGLVESAKQGGTLRAVLDGILLVLKTLALGAATVGKAFVALGEAIGGSLAAATAVLSGDVSSAKAILADLKGNLTEQLDELADFRNSLFDPQSPTVVEVQAPTLVVPTGIIDELSPDDRSAERIASARLALANTEADAELKLLKAALAEQQKVLESGFKDRLVSIGDYYTEKTAIETQALDAEISRLRLKQAEQQEIANSAVNESDRIKATAALEKVEAELTLLNQRRARVQQTNARASAQAERELGDALLKARQELQQITGEASSVDRQAAIARSFQDLRDRLLVEGDVAGVELVDRLINVKAAQTNLAAVETEWRLVAERLRNTQDAISIQQQSGLLTERQARQQIVELQRQSAAEMEQLLPAMQEAAQAIGPEAVVRVQAWRNELQRTRLTVDELAPLWNRIGESFGSALNGMITGAQTWRAALAGIFQQVADAFLQQLVIQPFQQWVAMQARMLAVKLGFVQQEQAIDVAASGAKVAQKSAETTAVVSMDAAKAGAGAAASQASIPFVGPALAVAAMVAMVAAVMALLGNVKKFAAGGLVTGPGSATSDSIPARLSAGEYVLNAAAVKRVGVEFLHSINGFSQGPRVSGAALAFATGGLVPAAVAVPMQRDNPNANQGPNQGAGQGVRIVNVVDPEMAADYLNSSSGEKTILNILQRNAGAVRQVLS